MTGIAVKDLCITFGRLAIVNNISFQVSSGESLVLFGASGSGKTSILRAIAGLDPAATGSVVVGGWDVSEVGPEGRQVGMAFQNFALYPHMTAWENVASPLRARGMAREEIDRRVAAIAGLLRIDHVLTHQPRALSNGQKQRTALARALVGEPSVLLLDDPLRNVDAKLRYEMRQELPRLLRAADVASIYVTQDYREAMALGDRVAVLSDGVIVQCDTPDRIYEHPVSVTVASLFGDPPINILPVEAAGSDSTACGFKLPAHLVRDHRDRELVCGLRPHLFGVSASPNAESVPATILTATPMHERTVYLLRLEGGKEILISIADQDQRFEGDVHLTCDVGQALVFDAASDLLVESGYER